MRRLRRLVFVLAAVVAAFWLLGDRLSLQSDGRISKRPGVEKSIPELTGQGSTKSTGVDRLLPDDRAMLANMQPGSNPPRDVTDAQRQELIDYLNERWPHIMTEYDLIGVKVSGWTPGDDSYVGYFPVFAGERRLSTLRRQEPVIGCGYDFDRELWHCVSPMFESYFEWPDQPEPVLVDSQISDDLAYFAMAVLANDEHRAGGLIESIMTDRSDSEVVRIGVRLSPERGGDVEYRYYRFTPSEQRGYDFVQVNAPPPPEG